ncbi:MAG: DNA-directed RNA polymerase subunit H [Candidatus Micrarchaeota archaeon]|nr:DNA-directed RNA polymerase subunit H [Candidatus Micrarchaeota archaeon]
MSDKSAPSHELIPRHILLSKEEGEKVLAEFKVSKNQLPKIRLKDPALAGMGAKPGAIVKIERHDGSVYYRLVVEG